MFRLNLEILTCDPLKCTMNHPRLIVSIQMEEFISIQRVNPWLNLLVIDIPCLLMDVTNLWLNQKPKYLSICTEFVHHQSSPLEQGSKIALVRSCLHVTQDRELNGWVLDSRPRGRGFEPRRCHCVVSSSKNINPSLVLVQPKKTRSFITERLLMGRKESNKTNKTCDSGCKESENFDISSEFFFPIYVNSFCDAGQVPIFRYFEACWYRWTQHLIKISQQITLESGNHQLIFQEYKIRVWKPWADQNKLFQEYHLTMIWVSNRMDPDQARRFVRPDLGQICLHRLWADNTRRQSFMHWICPSWNWT